jgi:general nucleoside transport system permease protein
MSLAEGRPSVAGEGAISRADQLTAASRLRSARKRQKALAIGGGLFLLMAAVRWLTDSPDLTSSGTFGTALRLAVPIGLAALGGLWAERSGIVNIGLEGMMILGTWFGAWGAWQYGPWQGVAIGIAGGVAAGLLHALATVTFNVDHIISGVAIITLASGIVRYLSVEVYTGVAGGGATQSPRVEGVGTFDLPILSGGELFGWNSPDSLGWLEEHHWLVVSDLAGLLRGFTHNLSYLTLLAIILVPVTWWVLWRTVFGLRVRSCGEHPTAADSLGIPVNRMRYLALMISGGLAGLAGAFLAIEAAGIYRQGQTQGKGFIGLAALIFGNWLPFGAAAGAGLFGFADALNLRDKSAVHALLLFIAVAALVYAVVQFRNGKRRAALVTGLLGVLSGLWFATTDAVPVEFVQMTPYVVTLLVLAVATQRLRPPAADGKPWRKGQVE